MQINSYKLSSSSSNICTKYNKLEINFYLQITHVVWTMWQLIWRTPVVTSRQIRHEVTHIHRHLEEVQIGGYYGRISDLELALYFYEKSVALKKIVVDPTNQVNKRNPNAREIFRRENLARISAHIQLKHRISRGVVLEIL